MPKDSAEMIRQMIIDTIEKREAPYAASQTACRENLPATRARIKDVLPARAHELVDHITDAEWLEWFHNCFEQYIDDEHELARMFLVMHARARDVRYTFWVAHNGACWTTQEQRSYMTERLNGLVGPENYRIYPGLYLISVHENYDDADVAVAVPLTLAATAIMQLL